MDHLVPDGYQVSHALSLTVLAKNEWKTTVLIILIIIPIWIKHGQPHSLLSCFCLTTGMEATSQAPMITCSFGLLCVTCTKRHIAQVACTVIDSIKPAENLDSRGIQWIGVSRNYLCYYSVVHMRHFGQWSSNCFEKCYLSHGLRDMPYIARGSLHL